MKTLNEEIIEAEAKMAGLLNRVPKCRPRRGDDPTYTTLGEMHRFNDMLAELVSIFDRCGTCEAEPLYFDGMCKNCYEEALHG